MSSFQPAPIFQFTINPTIIPSIVTLRLRNPVNGYAIRSFDVVSATVTTTTGPIQYAATSKNGSIRFSFSFELNLIYLLCLLVGF